jgi:hypothetical protein
MSASLSMRAAAAFAAGALFFSLGFDAALAHGQMSFGPPAMRPGIAHGHGSAPGWRSGGGSSSTWLGARRDWRFSRNGGFRNRFGLFGGGFWYSPYAFGDTASGLGPVIVVGAPALNVYPDAIPAGADPSVERGCVIHKLDYDSGGKYLGERQTPEC